MRLIFDAHLDLALFALAYNRDQTETVAQINEREAGMTDVQARGGAVASLPEMRRGGVAVCQSTVAVRADRGVRPAAGYMRTDLDFATQEVGRRGAQCEPGAFWCESLRPRHRYQRTVDRARSRVAQGIRAHRHDSRFDSYRR